jgi:tRNA (guanine37-N1)-methyltransferase
MAFTATVLTMFPEAFPGPLGVSLIGSACEKEACGDWKRWTSAPFPKISAAFLTIPRPEAAPAK